MKRIHGQKAVPAELREWAVRMVAEIGKDSGHLPVAGPARRRELRAWVRQSHVLEAAGHAAVGGGLRVR